MPFHEKERRKEGLVRGVAAILLAALTGTQEPDSQLDPHPPRTEVQQPADAGEGHPHPPPPIRVQRRPHHRPFPTAHLQGHRQIHLRRTLDLALPRRRRGGRGGRMDRRRGAHLWRVVGDVHGVQRGAVEGVEVQTHDLMVRILVHGPGLKEFRLVVAGVDAVLRGAGGGHELPAVDGDWGQGEGAVGVLHPAAVLPLHHALWALGIGGCRGHVSLGIACASIGKWRTYDLKLRDSMPPRRIHPP